MAVSDGDLAVVVPAGSPAPADPQSNRKTRRREPAGRALINQKSTTILRAASLQAALGTARWRKDYAGSGASFLILVQVQAGPQSEK